MSTPATLTDKAKILIEALPYIQQLNGKTIVIKYGGSAMISEEQEETILQDITLLKCVGANPVVVHGGGPAINSMLEKLNIESKFHNGLRITDAATMDVVQMVLTGKINKDVVSKLNGMGVKSLGLCGKDANLIEVVKKPPRDGVDYGFVGQVSRVNVKLLEMLSKEEYVPVIAPIGVGPDGQSYNINADTVAGAIAGALNATRLLMLTDVPGVLDEQKRLIPELSVAQVEQGIASGMISGGMIPKVETCVAAVRAGTRAAVILDGRAPHACLVELFTEGGAGTIIRA